MTGLLPLLLVGGFVPLTTVFTTSVFAQTSGSRGLEEVKRLAESGDVEAQNNLGFAYSNGIGTPKNKAEAVKWYRKAAEQGASVAQFNLALMYVAGTGIPKNDAEAVKWFRKAAEQGIGMPRSTCSPCI